jgi:GDPmannose 4,6-dehydratase
MPSALILGVASQDGSYLAELLLRENYRVIGTVRKSPGDDLENITQIKPRIILENADLLDFSSITSIVKKYTPDEFYNLAGLTTPADSWSRAALVAQVNGLGPVNCLEAVRRFSPETRFFQASSREIFGSVDSGVADENTAVNPENPYASAKAYAHFMTGIYRQTGLFACSGILFNHESPRRPLTFVTRKISTAAACIKNKRKSSLLDRNGKLVLWDLDSQRDRGFAGDYVIAMWLMLQASTPGDYVIATDSLHSVGEICEIAFSHAGLNWQEHVLVDSKSKNRPDTKAVKGNFFKIKKDLGWKPEIKFKELIKMMVDRDLNRLSPAG